MVTETVTWHATAAVHGTELRRTDPVKSELDRIKPTTVSIVSMPIIHFLISYFHTRLSTLSDETRGKAVSVALVVGIYCY